jgi:integrase
MLDEFGRELILKESEILEASDSRNTRRAMDCAVKHFTHVFGARLPCTDVVLKDYLVKYAGVLSVSTLEQRRVLIARWHKEHGFEHNPNDSELVRKVMRGIRRKYVKQQKKAKPAQLSILGRVCSHLDAVVERLDDVGHCCAVRAARDRAMFLTSFWFGLRSDELIRLRLCDISFSWDATPPYFEIFIARSKTDRDAAGSTKRLELLPDLCPMTAIQEWIELRSDRLSEDEVARKNGDLPVFSKVDRWGRISKSHIHANSINKLFKVVLQSAGVDAHEYSTHSMRRGIANWIVDSGGSVAELQEWIGWKDARTAMRYLDGKGALPNKLIRRELSVAGLAPGSSVSVLGEPDD